MDDLNPVPVRIAEVARSRAVAVRARHGIDRHAAASQKREYRAYRAHRASRRDLGGLAYRTDGPGDATVTNDVIRGVACGQ